MPELTNLSRWLVLIGFGLAALGGLVYLLNRVGFPLGNLPGDVRFSLGSVSCFLPIASSILVSIVLTLLINLVARIMGK
jgi:hypothetical protein